MSILACKVCPLKDLTIPIHLNTVCTMQKHEYALDGKNLGFEAASLNVSPPSMKNKDEKNRQEVLKEI